MALRPKLTYFDIRGRAEPIRLMLHASGEDFEDHRILSRDEWSELKPRAPFGALPLYEAHDQSIPESHAISRHLARTFGWAGSNEAHDVLLDVAQESIAEAQEDLWRFAWVERYDEKFERYAKRVLEPRLGRLQAWFERGDRSAEYWVGESATHVDFLAYCYLDELDAFFPDVLKRFERLAAFRKHIESIPSVAEYIASGDRPIVFGMGILGPKVDRRRPILAGARFESPWMDPIDLA